MPATEAVTADVHHVVDSARDPEIAVVVAAGGVAGEVDAGHAAELLLLKAVGIAERLAIGFEMLDCVGGGLGVSIGVSSERRRR